MNGIRCSRINEVRINLSAKIKVSNIIWAISRVGDSNRFSLELRRPTPIMLVTRKSRMMSAAVSASLSVIVVLISNM